MSETAASPAMQPGRIIICGGRTYNDWALMRRVLSSLHYSTVIVHGGAKGADLIAAQVWRRLHPDTAGAVEEWPADWGAHGRAAGPIRNQKMLDAGANHVIAFPGGRGTADMVRRARLAGVPVWEIGERVG